MSNDYYNQTGWPATGSSGASANARSELADIAAGFDKLPGLSGNANKIVGVNSSGDGLEAKSITFAGAFSTVGAYAVTFTFTGVTGVTFPTAGTLATRAGSETLTNKTINGPDNTLTNIANASLANSSLTVNGTAISLGGSGTVTAAAGTLTGATLASNVVNASINAITPSGGTLAVTGSQTVSVNMGINVTPGPWASGANALQIGSVAALAQQSNGSTALMSNARESAANTYVYLASAPALRLALNPNTGAYEFFGAASGTVGNIISFAPWLTLNGSANLLPGADNAQTFGNGSLRWSVIYAASGTINTSDEREKTAVSKLTPAEISAAKALAKEIGSFRFLGRQRTHIGMTVQRAIQIMEAWGLDPLKYAFICHDVWEREVVEHPAIEAQPATPAMPAVYETREYRETVILDGEETELVRTYLHEVSPAVSAKDAVQAKNARTEVIREAGDRYGFRYDQLMMFIAAGVLA